MKTLAALLLLILAAFLALGGTDAPGRRPLVAHAGELMPPEPEVRPAGGAPSVGEDSRDTEPLRPPGPGRPIELERPELVVPPPPVPGPRRTVAGAPVPAGPQPEVSLEAPRRSFEPPQPRPTRQELWERLGDASLAALITELRDDDVPWNATLAMSELVSRIDRDAGARRTLHEDLLPHLGSTDRQLRALSVALLLRVGLAAREAGEPFEPTAALLDAALEWMRGRPVLDSRFWAVNKHLPVEFALAYADRMEGRLAAELGRSPDDEGFLHAFVLGATGKGEHADLAAPVLLPHLRDNGEDDDACLAQRALAGLGPAVLPHLDGALAEADEQQRLGIEAVRLQVLAPCLDEVDAAQRAQLNGVTWKVDFPPSQYTYGHASSWRFEW